MLANNLTALLYMYIIFFPLSDKLYVLNKDLNVADGGEYTWNSSRPCSQQVGQQPASQPAILCYASGLSSVLKGKQAVALKCLIQLYYKSQRLSVYIVTETGAIPKLFLDN